jgi:glycosyltransferase involved in cell wall biosynthesis
MIKIVFIHYNFGHDGITRVVLNNIKGLKELHPEYEVSLLGSKFHLKNSELYEKKILKELGRKEIPRNPEVLFKKANNLYKKLAKATKDYDLIIIENPTIGLFPIQSIAFKKLAEEKTNVVYRIHDMIEDKPAAFSYLKSIEKDYRKLIYPKKTRYLVINSEYAKRFEKIAPLDICLLPDSIVPEDYSPDDPERIIGFRKQLVKDKLIKSDEKIILYPVRIIERKNIEEALLITMILNKIESANYKLIVTMKEERFPEDREYLNRLKIVARQRGIKCVLGGINKKYKFYGESDEDIPGEKYRLKDLFAVSDVVITTSMLEGFGYCFLEPFLAGKPLIGRMLKNTEEDFRKAKIDLSNLYSKLLIAGQDYGKLAHHKRIDVLKYLSDNGVDYIIKKNNLKKCLDLTNMKRVEKNKNRIISKFNYLYNTDFLLKLCKNKILKPQA